MSDNTELKRLAEALLASDDHADFPGWMAASDAFDNATGPAAILALIAEKERLVKHLQNALGGQMALVCERDLLKAEVAGLKTGYEAYERVNAELRAEVEALRREREGKVLCDLELFETLRDSANTEADEHRQCMATYRPLRQANLDSVVKKCDDLLAALGQGEQS